MSFSHLFQFSTAVFRIIEAEIKLKETVINFLINILAKQQTNQQTSGQHLKASFTRWIAQSIDSFDDLNVYIHIKETLEAIRAKQYLGNNNYLDIVLALVKADFSALHINQFIGNDFQNFIGSFNNANDLYTLFNACNIDLISPYFADIFALLAKHLQNKDKLLALNALANITRMNRNVQMGQHANLLIKYIGERLPDSIDYRALTDALENLGNNEASFVNSIKTRLAINDNNVTDLSTLLVHVKNHDIGHDI